MDNTEKLAMYCTQDEEKQKPNIVTCMIIKYTNAHQNIGFSYKYKTLGQTYFENLFVLCNICL
jgi:hypothetical protein